MGRMSELDLRARVAGLTDADIRTLPLVEVMRAAEPFDWQTAARGFDAAARLLVARMECDGVEEPLGQPFTLAAVLADLYGIMGAPAPRALASYLG